MRAGPESQVVLQQDPGQCSYVSATESTGIVCATALSRQDPAH